MRVEIFSPSTQRVSARTAVLAPLESFRLSKERSSSLVLCWEFPVIKAKSEAEIKCFSWFISVLL